MHLILSQQTYNVSLKPLNDISKKYISFLQTIFPNPLIYIVLANKANRTPPLKHDIST